MPMMYGFAVQRRQMLESELQRLVDEMPQLGMQSMYLVGPFSKGDVDPSTVLDLVVVQETDEVTHRRADFWTTHLRPRIGINFYVYTPHEFENNVDDDLLLQYALSIGERVYG
ncbi:MAG: hypothetical protein VYC65_00625 [Chloroflexota bacterium]|nr:hypothetical protein [Chloroflexota bacterium]MQG38277.1 hypothetical protein [SAR202 cluster bacterium]